MLSLDINLLKIIKTILLEIVKTTYPIKFVKVSIFIYLLGHILFNFEIFVKNGNEIISS